MANVESFNKENNRKLFILLAIIFGLVIIGALINGGKTSNDGCTEELYTKSGPHTWCPDREQELNDKHAEEWDEYQKQQRADEDSYWADKYQEQQYNY